MLAASIAVLIGRTALNRKVINDIGGKNESKSKPREGEYYDDLL